MGIPYSFLLGEEFFSMIKTILCAAHEDFSLSQSQTFFLLSPQYLEAAGRSCVQPSPAGVRTVLEIESLPGELCLQLELFSHPNSFPGFPVKNHQFGSCCM